MSDRATDLLSLRRQLALARLLLQLHAPSSPLRVEALTAVDEVLQLLIDAEVPDA